MVVTKSKGKAKSKSAIKKLEKQKLKEETILKSFNNYYEEIYGKDRWNNELFPSLKKYQNYGCLINRFSRFEDTTNALKSVQNQLNILHECFINKYNIDYTIKCLTLIEKNENNILEIQNNLKSISLNDNQNENENETKNGNGNQEEKEDNNDILIDTDMLCDKKKKLPFPKPQKDITGISTHYLLDYASVVAANCLDIKPNHKVLDTCSAPGGKALVLFQKLGKMGTLHVNEINGERRKHLRRVLQEYIPKNSFEQQISMTSLDLSIKGSGKEFPGGYNHYDRVLVDAPCSSERHLIHNMEKELLAGNWTNTHSKTMSKKQRNILLEAVKCTKEGGLLLYATCSLANLENDEVINYVIKKYNSSGGKLELTSMKKLTNDFNKNIAGLGESTSIGWIILPDQPGGWGPLYFCLIDVINHPLTNDFIDTDD